MKKIFLTFAVFGFGATVAFAQTNPEVETDQPQTELQVEKLSNSTEMEGKKKIEMSELPAAVQEAFQNSEFKDWEVAEIYEVEATQEENINLSATSEESASSEEVTYEISLLSKDMKDEIEDSQEAVAEGQEEAVEENVEATTETIEVEVPALLLQYDKEGKLLKQEEQKSDNKLEELENEQY
jgi:hypothetical protein